MKRTKPVSWPTPHIAILWLAICGALGVFAPAAQALPSFARQTGQPCSSCHVQSFGGSLTTLGREFKLGGYTMASAKGISFPPISAMVQGSFTNTGKGQAGGAAPGFGENNNGAFDGASLFYAGRVTDNLGALIEVHYDPFENHISLDTTDIRFAKSLEFLGKPMTAGVSMNNNPGAQDLWNTMPAWGFPYFSSSLAPTPMNATLLDGGLAGTAGGVTSYLMWNKLLYLEAGAYAPFNAMTQKAMSTYNPASSLAGAAPYWRAALQHSFKNGAYLSAGFFGLQGDLNPGWLTTVGTDHYRDLGIDWTYQHYLGGSNDHILEVKGRHIWEQQNLRATNLLGGADNLRNTLNNFNLNASYTYQQTYGMTFGYFKTDGTIDATLYAAAPSLAGRPNSEGYHAELVYVPFGKNNSYLAPWVNMRLALQYTAYTQFNGTGKNYDGEGRNASDNNTLFLNGWVAF
jgi:hypothetical protein